MYDIQKMSQVVVSLHVQDHRRLSLRHISAHFDMPVIYTKHQVIRLSDKIPNYGQLIVIGRSLCNNYECSNKALVF